jgi:hypothetical protein
MLPSGSTYFPAWDGACQTALDTISISPGHYLDLVSAILGFILLPLGLLGSALMRRKNSN